MMEKDTIIGDNSSKNNIKSRESESTLGINEHNLLNWIE
jgi:hypothetical protein